MIREPDPIAVELLLAGKRAVKDVHPDDRDGAIIHLHVVEGLTSGEIAHRLGASTTTTRRVLAEWQARQERLDAGRVA